MTSDDENCSKDPTSQRIFAPHWLGENEKHSEKQVEEFQNSGALLLWIRLRLAWPRGWFCNIVHAMLQTRGPSLKPNLKPKLWFQKGTQSVTMAGLRCISGQGAARTHTQYMYVPRGMGPERSKVIYGLMMENLSPDLITNKLHLKQHFIPVYFE